MVPFSYRTMPTVKRPENDNEPSTVLCAYFCFQTYFNVLSCNEKLKNHRYIKLEELSKLYVHTDDFFEIL